MSAESIVEAVMQFIRDNRVWAGPIVFVLAFGESMAFVSLVLPFWAMLVGIGTAMTALGLDFMTIWIAASLGAGAGDWASYWIGSTFKYRIKYVWPLSRYPKLLPLGRLMFKRYGWMAIVLGRFFAPMRASVPLVAGLCQMPMVPFQLANFGSAFLWAGALLAPGLMLSWWWPWLQPYLASFERMLTCQ